MSANRYRVGCVPYLNGRPLVAWFHEGSGARYVDVVYAVPSELAIMLKYGQLDAAMVSSYETLENPETTIISDCAIAADGDVRSVRLFSNCPIDQIRSVALDSSSLTSSALTQVLLREQYQISPRFVRHSPDLSSMLAHHDAALIIGDLRIFEDAAPMVLDLGGAWKRMTGLPFLYAAWLSLGAEPAGPLSELLSQARDWGLQRIEEVACRWSTELALPINLVREYYSEIMQYRLNASHLQALELYGSLCREYGILPARTQTRGASDAKHP